MTECKPCPTCGCETYNETGQCESALQLTKAKAQIVELEKQFDFEQKLRISIAKNAKFFEDEMIALQVQIDELEKELRCYKADDCEECEYVNREREVKALQARIDAAVEVLILSMAGKSSPTQAVADAVIILGRDENKPTDACELIAVKRMLSEVLSKLGGE